MLYPSNLKIPGLHSLQAFVHRSFRRSPISGGLACFGLLKLFLYLLFPFTVLSAANEQAENPILPHNTSTQLRDFADFPVAKSTASSTKNKKIHSNSITLITPQNKYLLKVKEKKIAASPRTPRPEYSQILSEQYAEQPNGFVTKDRLFQFLVSKQYLNSNHAFGDTNQLTYIEEIDPGSFSQQIFMVYTQEEREKINRLCIKILSDSDGSMDTQTFAMEKDTLRHVKNEVTTYEEPPTLITPSAYYLFTGWDCKTHHLQLHNAARGKSLQEILKEKKCSRKGSSGSEIGLRLKILQEDMPFYSVGKALGIIQSCSMIKYDNSLLCHTHGDAHPGNIFYDSLTEKVSFIDLTETKTGSPFDDIFVYYFVPLFYWNQISDHSPFTKIKETIRPFFTGYFEILSTMPYFPILKDYIMRYFELTILNFQCDIASFRDGEFGLPSANRSQMLNEYQKEYFDKVRKPLKLLYNSNQKNGIELAEAIQRRSNRLLTELRDVSKQLYPTHAKGKEPLETFPPLSPANSSDQLPDGC